MNNKNIKWAAIGIIAIVVIIIGLKTSTNKSTNTYTVPPTVETSETALPQSSTPTVTTPPSTGTTTTSTHTTTPAPRPAPTPVITVISGTAHVSIQNMKFSPSNIYIKKGSIVVWKNNDTATHTIVADGGFGANSDKLTPGDGYSYTFPNAGTFTYHCGIHPFMTGTVTVVN